VQDGNDESYARTPIGGENLTRHYSVGWRQKRCPKRLSRLAHWRMVEIIDIRLPGE